MGLAEFVGLTVASDREMSLEEWQSRVTHPLQNLLNLASARPNVLTQLTFLYPGDAGNPRDLMPVRVIQHVINPRPRDGRVRIEGEVLFTLVDIPCALGSSWIAGLGSRTDSARCWTYPRE